MTSTREPWRAVLFDWAGTTIDFGCRAPARVFVEIFQRRGVEITLAEARGPMGRAKRDHILDLLALPRVREAWRAVHGSPPAEADARALYDDFLPLQLEILSRGCDVIPGVVEAIAACRSRGARIGSTTGYTRALMEVVRPLAAQNGYAPDVVVCSDEVTAGRPAPWMNFLAAERLGVYPMRSILVVDDTPVGIEAGLHAGCVTAAVTLTGNALGLSPEEIAALPTEELERRLADIESDFRRRGAHFVLRSVAELPGLWEERA